jgi:hypothetical protein
MFYVKTENVDKLSVPFGVVIGPCTVLSNSVKLIGDVARIAFYGLSSINYLPSTAYADFKNADLAWEKNVSPKHKPQVSSDGYIQMTFDSFTDREYNATINQARGTPTFFNWSIAYRALSSQDRRQIAFEQAKQDFIQHLTFIGIGIIRSIPLVGGVARWAYNAKQAN